MSIRSDPPIARRVRKIRKTHVDLHRVRKVVNPFNLSGNTLNLTNCSERILPPPPFPSLKEMHSEFSTLCQVYETGHRRLHVRLREGEGSWKYPTRGSSV